MPISVAALASKRHTATLDIDGEPLTVTYRPYTIAEREAMAESAQRDMAGGDIAATKFLADILLGWDLPVSEDDPSIYPHDYRSLAALPGEFIAAVLMGIAEAQTQGKR